MRPPSFSTLVLGNAFVVLTSMCLAAYLCWLCYLNVSSGSVLVALSGLWLMDRAFTASEICRRYRAWRRDYVAVSGSGTTNSAIPLWLRQTIGVCVLCCLCVCLASQNDPLEQWAALGPGLAVLLVTLQPLVRLLRRLKRALVRKPAAYRGPVLVVIPGPIQAVPVLGDAYRLVPDYCRQVMQARR